MTRLFILFMLLFLSDNSKENTNQTKWKEIIVSIQPTKSINDITSLLEKEKNRQEFSFIKPKKLSHSMNIWLMKINSNNKVFSALFQEIAQHSSTHLIQKNHEIKYRNSPNDDMFDKQWQYFNNGRINGLLDADMDATEAWEITTGGKTSTGDEIVIAIIDNGIDLDHPDLEGNIWTNPGEIPGNEIDDDNNGYIDDYYGWNFLDSTNDVINHTGNMGKHGTPVAGIIGAKGNNSIGICGVNWNVKLLNIVKNAAESEASIIEAYSYIMDLRKKYNESNGQEGAFIVATNASWGVEGITEKDAPIWCAVYDSLGSVGVLNVGATANKNVDVNVVGDLPSNCQSDYLIMVTNMTNQDKKLRGAGYAKPKLVVTDSGIDTIPSCIDLGAPGEEVYTLNYDGGYKLFEGTSSATPHVTGTIGLLYSVPCLELMKDAKESPQKTASLMKAFILAGVDEIEGLKGITVTGGRLNSYNSIRELQKYYGCENISSDLQKYGVEIHNIYPNPASDWIRISYEINDRDNKETPLHIGMNNSIGEYIGNIRQLGVKKNGHYEVELDTSNLKRGIYFLSIRKGNKPIKAEKIIVL